MKKYLNYKGVKVNSFGIPTFLLNQKDNSKIIRSDKKYYQYQIFNNNFKKDSPKNLIVMYDIPYEKRKERDWFRRHLKRFNYIMIQKSVWVGPSPLPKDFLKYVKSLGLIGQFKTFKLARPYTKNEKVL